MTKLIIYDIENTAIRDMDMLHPLMRGPVERMQIILAKMYADKLTPDNFQVFETWRHPNRQRALGANATKASAWRSPHQFGMAADFAVFRSPDTSPGASWSWADGHDWALLKRVAKECGLTVPINWDKGHIEHPRWASMKQYLR